MVQYIPCNNNTVLCIIVNRIIYCHILPLKLLSLIQNNKCLSICTVMLRLCAKLHKPESYAEPLNMNQIFC